MLRPRFVLLLLGSLLSVPARGWAQPEPAQDSIPAEATAAPLPVADLYAGHGLDEATLAAMAALRIPEPAQPKQDRTLLGRPGPGAPAPAQDSVYADRYIWISGAHGISTFATGGNDYRAYRYQGNKRHRLHDEDLYLALERPDLAIKYKQRNRRRQMVGVVSLTGGIALGITAVAVTHEECGKDGAVITEECRRRNGQRLAVGAILSCAGIVGSFVIMGAMNPHPVSPAEARRLVAKHNARLRGAIRLSDGQDGPSVSHRVRDSLELVPFASADGGGLMLGGHF